MHSVLLRGRCFWFYNAPSNASWSWRKILLSRSWCRGLFSPKIGNGLQTFLWLDYWLPNGKRICDILPFRQLSKTGLTCDAKVSSIISEGRWTFPVGQPELQLIWNSIQFFPQPHQPDICNWKGLHSGKFSIDSAWELLRDKRPINSSFHLIWFPDHIPRHAFILWIASMRRLHKRIGYSLSRSSRLPHVHYVDCMMKRMITYFLNVATPPWCGTLSVKKVS